MRHVSTALFIAALTAAPAFAQSITAGTAEGGNCYPFFCYQDGARYQQVYSSTLFPDPYSVNSLTFFITAVTPSYDFTGQTFDVFLTTTTRSVGGLSRIFEENVGADRTLFASFTPVGAAGSTFTITGDPSFSYNPYAGNLLLDVIAHGVNPNGDPTFVDADQNNPDMSRVFFLTPTTQGMTDAFLNQPVIGLVTEFQGTVTPEPGSALLMVVGLGGVGMLVGRRKAGRRLAATSPLTSAG